MVYQSISPFLYSKEHPGYNCCTPHFQTYPGTQIGSISWVYSIDSWGNCSHLVTSCDSSAMECVLTCGPRGTTPAVTSIWITFGTQTCNMTGCWFQTFFIFPFHIWDVVLPIDELIFFKMVIAPPTRLFYHVLLYLPYISLL